MYHYLNDDEHIITYTGNLDKRVIFSFIYRIFYMQW